MNPEDIMLSKINQIYMISHVKLKKRVKPIVTVEYWLNEA